MDKRSDKRSDKTLRAGWKGVSSVLDPMMMRMTIRMSENDDDDDDDAERRGVPSVLDPTPGGSVSNFPLSQKVS